MQRITASKLNVLKDPHGAYEKKKQATLGAVQTESDLSTPIRILLDALVVHEHGMSTYPVFWSTTLDALKPALASDTFITTFDRIQQRLFSGSFGCSSVIKYPKRTIAERFNVKDVPDGFLYYPTELGGLDLRNILIPLLLAREVEGTAAGKEKQIGEAKK
ncbi:MAG: hypothetical protein Q9166_005860 [cf. Caloplaca sp. 2 TL-2023]